ncbi:MAG: protein phosphatase 2C domain-containing protein [Thermoguttaceae bacterium]|jgi:serine/threonine protein phosphatase PrpC|nr:protein phosphatase 2C domain-containing protein [Thermoguttaceae bacterium]
MDIEVFFQTDMPRAERHAIGCGETVTFSARSPGKETANEDSAALVALDSRGAVLVVADGMGGMPAGEQAAGLAVRKMIASLQDRVPNEPSLRGAILNGIEDANRAICELGLGAGSTITVVEIQGHTVRPYHVGDSMILVAGQRGKLKLQTVSHSPVGYAVESGVLDEAEAMHHEDRHLVSNMLGTPDMRIEVGSTLELSRFDTLLLATDGLFDNLHTHEVVNCIRKGPLDRVAQELADQCRRRMTELQPGLPSKPDDLTFIIFRRLATAGADR